MNKEIIKFLKSNNLELSIISSPTLLDKLDNTDANLIDSFNESNTPFISEVQKLDKSLYGGIGADHWVVYTFGSKAGFMPVVTNEDGIISYSQVVGCIEEGRAQLWGIGTRKDHQRKGLGTLTFEITKEVCRSLGKHKLEINVEPENVSNKIYCKYKPKILCFGEFYPNESPRNILSVSLNPDTDPLIKSSFEASAYDYKKMKELHSLPGEKYLLDWKIKDEIPYIIIGLNEKFKI